MSRRRKKELPEEIEEKIEKTKSYFSGLRLCPRCSEPISYIEDRVVERIGEDGTKHTHIYYYAVHYHGYTLDNGRIKPILRRCYLGAEEYEYVDKVNELGLKGYTHPERYVSYVWKIAEKLNINDGIQATDMIIRKLYEKAETKDDRIRIIIWLEELIEMLAGKSDITEIIQVFDIIVGKLISKVKTEDEKKMITSKLEESLNLLKA